jgi:hypothetical protein
MKMGIQISSLPFIKGKIPRPPPFYKGGWGDFILGNLGEW